jgi:hypothetical protein
VSSVGTTGTTTVALIGGLVRSGRTTSAAGPNGVMVVTVSLAMTKSA